MQHTRDILVAVLKVVSPENAGYLWTALQGSRAVNDELGVEGILHPAQRVYLEAIAETYKNASSWDTRRQILSIMTGTGASLAAIREYIPGLTQYRYFLYFFFSIDMYFFISFSLLLPLILLQVYSGKPAPTSTRHRNTRANPACDKNSDRRSAARSFLTVHHKPTYRARSAFWPKVSASVKWQRSGSTKCYSSPNTGANSQSVHTVLQRSELHPIQPKNNASDTVCV